MTRAELRKYVRGSLNEASTGWIADSTDPTLLSIDDYLNIAYRRYAQDTRAFPVDYTLAATPDQGVYSFADFGIEVNGETTVYNGKRLIEIDYVEFNGIEIDPITKARANVEYRGWRTMSAGVPARWLRTGTKTFRLIAPPATDDNIFIDGFEVPDCSLWTDDLEPDIEECDHTLIGMLAAIYIAVRGIDQTNEIRKHDLFPIYQAGATAAFARIHGSNGANIEIGRYAGTRGVTRRVSSTIISA